MVAVSKSAYLPDFDTFADKSSLIGSYRSLASAVRATSDDARPEQAMFAEIARGSVAFIEAEAAAIAKKHNLSSDKTPKAGIEDAEATVMLLSAPRSILHS